MSDPIDLAQFEGHTPGPWTCHVMTRDVDVEAPCGRTIFICPIKADDQVVADARLIAAGPSLLAELRTLRAADESRKRRDAAVDELVSKFREYGRSNVQHSAARAAFQVCADKLEAALAAIKGEAK